MWVLDLISALAGLAALAFVLFGKRSRLPRRALWLLVGLLGVITLHGVSNTLERSGLTDRTDPAEDYIELFMPLLWGFFLYVFAEHEARGALRASERQKSAILQAINDHVVYHDADMRVVWANQAAADGAGLPVEELVGRTCYELWHGRILPGFYWSHAVTEGSGYYAPAIGFKPVFNWTFLVRYLNYYGYPGEYVNHLDSMTFEITYEF
jgi:PAS domain-containing protein